MPPKASGTIYGTFKSMLVGNTVRHLTRDVSQRQWTEGASRLLVSLHFDRLQPCVQCVI